MRWLIGKILCLAGRHDWPEMPSDRHVFRTCRRCFRVNPEDVFEPMPKERPW